MSSDESYDPNDDVEYESVSAVQKSLPLLYTCKFRYQQLFQPHNISLNLPKNYLNPHKILPHSVSLFQLLLGCPRIFRMLF